MGAVIPRPASWLVSEYFRVASKCCQQQTFALPVDSINQDPVELDMGIPIMSPFAFKRVVCILRRQWFLIHQQGEERIKFTHIFPL